MSKIREKERREFIRLQAYHLIKYRPFSPGKEQEMRPVLGAIKDIGGGGVCLRIEQPLPVASLIELKINFPHIATAIYALAKVIWTKELRKANLYEIGVQFVQIEDSLRQIIDDQIKSVYRRQKRLRFPNLFLRRKGGKK